MMTSRAWGFVTALALAQVCAGGWHAFAQTPAIAPPSRPAWCPASQGASPTPALPKLAALAAKVRRGEAITVVAIGSSSTEGSDLPDRLLAYPTHLQRQLSARIGTAAVKMVNKGRGGENMIETVARFAADVADEKPDLVVWQLGVNDVVRDYDMGVSERVIEDGMAQLKHVGVPVVLMDMQLAPRVTASAKLPVMRGLLQAAATRHQAFLWSRYELMDSIIRSGDARPVDLIKPDDLHMTVAMHVCTGAVLGDVIAAGIALRPSSGVVAAKTP